MKEIIRWLNESAYINSLSSACKMCAQGSKMVVLATGICPTSCYYCPLSFKKGGKDRIFANEWELNNEEDTRKLISEGEFIDATGAGITGGDPLLVWQRVKKYILLLKDYFGSDFHIHLYTSGLKNADHLTDLVAAGLDEVRFHPQPEYWNNMNKSPIQEAIKHMLNTSTDVVIEIPSIPSKEKEILSLVEWANNFKLSWINLNELEYSERNCELLYKKGYVTKNEISAAVKGSQETALKVLKIVQEKNLDIGVHYCSVSFKDGVQLKNRLLRRANNIAKEYEIITEEGTLLKGAIYTNSSLEQLVTKLRKEYEIPQNLVFLDEEKNRVEIAAWILEKIAEDLNNQGHECCLVEEYPTADRLEVERIPLPLSS